MNLNECGVPPTPDMPMVLGEVIGYRVWACGVPGGAFPAVPGLLPITWMTRSRTPWARGPNTASCSPANNFLQQLSRGNPAVKPHSPFVPGVGCDCGFWAYRDPDDPRAKLLRDANGFVAGAIKAWGRIEIRSHGFRAEHAEIIALSPNGDDEYSEEHWRCRQLPQLAERYGVPLLTSLAALRAAFPPSLPLAEEVTSWPTSEPPNAGSKPSPSPSPPPPRTGNRAPLLRPPPSPSPPPAEAV